MARSGGKWSVGRGGAFGGSDKVWTPKKCLSKSEVIRVRSSLSGREEDETGGLITKGRTFIHIHSQTSFQLSSFDSCPGFKIKSDMKDY